MWSVTAGPGVGRSVFIRAPGVLAAIVKDGALAMKPLDG